MTPTTTLFTSSPRAVCLYLHGLSGSVLPSHMIPPFPPLSALTAIPLPNVCLALRVVAESRIVSRRIWVERQAASVLESFSRRAQQLQATAVQFASDHALGLLVFYGFFPAKAVGR